MNTELITRDTELADLCRALRGSAWLALDTEFLRERTYSARLCLIQVANRDTLALIDPLAVGDLSPFLAILHETSSRKVLHAARQDLEVFYDLDKRLPEPVFDTQIAAAFLGHDDQAGYATLVAALTGTVLPKGETRTDWSARPLTSAQLAYAADDVRYLRVIYEQLLEQLDARGRLAWAEAECLRLTDPALYANDPEQAWRRLRGGADLPVPAQQILRELAVWREQEAQRRNLPRAWVLRDEVLFELARRAPATAQALTSITGLDDKSRSRHGAALLAAMAAARAQEPRAIWEKVLPLTGQQINLVKQTMARIRELAGQHELAAALLATRRDVERLVRGADPAAVFRGWRAELLAPVWRDLIPNTQTTTL
jgi:ribonuclease D